MNLRAPQGRKLTTQFQEEYPQLLRNSSQPSRSRIPSGRIYCEDDCIAHRQPTDRQSLQNSLFCRPGHHHQLSPPHAPHAPTVRSASVTRSMRSTAVRTRSSSQTRCLSTPQTALIKTPSALGTSIASNYMTPELYSTPRSPTMIASCLPSAATISVVHRVHMR
jgi:hypothetical protein